MKNDTINRKTIIVIAILFALSFTFYVGGFNSTSTQFYLNTLLVNITFIGDSFFAFGLVVFLYFFFNKKRKAFELLLAILISLCITQVIKNVFSNLPTQLFFESGVVENPNDISSSSIISSHVAIAFTLCGFLYLNYFKRFFGKSIIIIVAILVAITRTLLAEETLPSLLLGIFPAAVSFTFLLKIKLYKSAYNNSYYREDKPKRNFLKLALK